MSTTGDENDRPSLTPTMAQAGLKERQKARETVKARRHAAGEAFKGEGNTFFKQGQYSDAITKFNQATIVNGLQPVYMSNLAMAYLKLEQYDLAEWSADCALLHCPLMFKARYRRAMARKGLGMYKAAEIDFKTILDQDPENKEARTGLSSVQVERKKYGDGPEGSVSDLKFPPLSDYEEWEYPIDSDSEESNHVGNRTPCKFHNHGGCTRGSKCHYSHAPDRKSVRDKLGQNVCLDYLLGKCKHGSSCAYAHTKEYLGEGWWNNEQEVHDTKMLLSNSSDLDSDLDRLETLENTTVYGRQLKAERFQRYLQHSCKLTAEDLNSKISEKATSGDPSDRFVLLLSLEDKSFDDVHKHLLNALKAKTKIVRARNPPEALTNLTSTQLAGVFITDAGILRASSNIMSALVNYAKNGGSVVFAGSFATFASSPDVNRFFEKNFQLPWKYGSYFRSTFTKNPANDLVKWNPSLPKSYSMKAVHLSNINADSAVYRATDKSHTQSHVFPTKKIEDFGEAPAVSASFGKGRISFLGDVNSETESTPTVLAMLGLLGDVSSVSKSNAATTTSQSTGSVVPKKKQTAKKTTNTNTSGISLSDFNIVGQAGLALSSSASPVDLTSSSTQPSILFLSMGDQGSMHSQVYEEQIDAIQTKTTIVHVNNEIPLRGNLKSYPSLKCIYVTDAAISERKNLHLTKPLVEFVKDGGRLVFGGTFSSFVKPNDIAPLFSKFGLKWSAGDYTRSTLALNFKKNSFAETNPFLPKEINIKALSLANVDVKDVVYYHADRQLGSQTQSPIIFKKIEKGYIGYIGDVNAEKSVNPSMYSMMGFMNNPSTIVQPPPSSKFVIALTNSTKINNYNNTLMKELTKKSIKVLGSEQLDDVRIVELLKSPDLVGVLVLEEVFYPQEKKWLENQVAAYIWSGGKVIFCDKYVTSTSPQGFEHFFSDLLFLSWFFASPQKLKATFNKQHSLFSNAAKSTTQKSILADIPEVIKSYEGVHLRGLYEHDMVYRSDASDGWGNWPVVPVSYAEVGTGSVGFFGHLKLEVVDSKLVLLMLGI